jgi:hypothetical protein
MSSHESIGGGAMNPTTSLPELADSLAPPFPGRDDGPLARDLRRMIARGGPRCSRTTRGGRPTGGG